MNNILAQLHSVPMYAICGGIIAFVAVVCVIFLVRSYRAGLAIGIDPARMKRAITSSATFSVLPSVGILLGVIALSGSLGTPWPWLRLSVIGALHYETQVAQAAAEQVGMHALSAAEMTPQGFTTIALLMSVCIMWGMILSIFFNKRSLKRLGTDGAKSASGVGFGDSDSLFYTLRYIADKFPDSIMVYPGHNYGDVPAATLGELKKSNLFLRCNTLERFRRAHRLMN